MGDLRQDWGRSIFLGRNIHDHGESLSLQSVPVAHVHNDDNSAGSDDQDNNRHEDGDGTLGAELLQVGVCFLMQLIEVCRLPHGLLTLHQEHIGIVTSDECRFQEVLFLVWFVLKDIDGELDELVAMGRIDIAGIQQGVADQFDAPTFARQTVDTTEFGGIGNAFLFHSFAGTHRHAVVLCENEIDMAEVTLIVFNSRVASPLISNMRPFP